MAVLLHYTKDINISMMKNAVLATITKALNAYLDLDPESKQRLHSLQDKVITIELLPFHFTFQCTFNSDGFHIDPEEVRSPDATLRGTPLQMLNVLLMPNHRQRFFTEDLTIEGDASFGQQVVELFDHLSIDWEDYVSHFVGDIPAHHAGRFINRINTWLNATEESLTQNINEYLHEEIKWLPTREALSDFFTDIDNTRMDVDRIEAKISYLHAKLTEHKVSQ